MTRNFAALLATAAGWVGRTTIPRQQTTAAAAPPGQPSTADALRRLREGNARFVNDTPTVEHRGASRRAQIAHGQHPFAVVLGCSDSRVPPEIVFDQGLGDLFVIRIAGEVAPPEVIGSIEYAVEHLGCRTVIVLGHERCGMVEAALNASADHAAHGHAAGSHLGGLIRKILPGIEQVDRESPDALDAAVFANARAVARRIVAHSKLLAEMSHTGDVQITPARYDLDTGVVEFMQPVGGADEGAAGPESEAGNPKSASNSNDETAKPEAPSFGAPGFLH